MNQRAQQRLRAIEAERINLTRLAEDLSLGQEERSTIASRLRELLEESENLESGDHPLRGNTTAENKDLFDAVQRAIGGKVIKS